MLNRLVFHHTGGSYVPNSVDLDRYHGVIDGDAQMHNGRHRFAANFAGQRLVAGRYAAHTRGLNGGAGGLAIGAMNQAQWASPFASSRFPVKPAQVDALIDNSARVCLQFGIEPHRRFTLSHAEVEITLGVKQANKWDFDYWPRGGPGSRDPIAIGDELRAELANAIRNLRGAVTAVVMPPPINRPTLAQGSRSEHVVELQKILNTEGARLRVEGAFGPATRTAVIAFQRRNQLLPDGVVGPLTWAALTS